MTADDVVFSFKMLKEKGIRISALVCAMCVGRSARRAADRALHVQGRTQSATCRRSVSPRCRSVAKAFYATRAFDMTTLEPPLGSGPYEIGEFKQGTFVTYKRAAGLLGQGSARQRGQYNFDEIRFEYFRDRTASSWKA